MRKNLLLFCETTTIHGFYYIGRNRGWVEAAFWVLVVALAVVCVGLVCGESYKGWREQPVVSVIETLSYDPNKV